MTTVKLARRFVPLCPELIGLTTGVKKLSFWWETSSNPRLFRYSRAQDSWQKPHDPPTLPHPSHHPGIKLSGHILIQLTATVFGQTNQSPAPSFWIGTLVLLVILMAITSAVACTKLKREQQARKREALELKATEERLADAEQQLVRYKRLSGLGELTARVAHEINNSLMSPLLQSERLAAGIVASDELQQIGQQILQGLGDATEVLRRIRPFYLGANAKRSHVDLASMVKTVAKSIRQDTATRTSGNHVRIKVDARPAELVATKTEMREILTSLGHNAVEAIQGIGIVHLRCHETDREVIVEVQDNGAGMTSEVHNHCVESFYSTKEKPALGLGLSIAQAIVESYSGSLVIKSEPNEGTTVTIRIPQNSPTET